MSSSGMPRARSARCPVLYPVSVALQPWLSVPLVSPWPSPLTWFPATSGSPAGASKTYPRNDCMPFSALVPSAPSRCLCRVPTLYPSTDVPRCRLGGAAVLDPRVIPLSSPLAPRASVARMVGDFPPHPQPCPSSPGTPYPSVSTPEVSSPQGNYSTTWVSMPCGDLNPPPTPWRSSLEFSATPEASSPPLSVSHSGGIAIRIFLPASDPRPFPS